MAHKFALTLPRDPQLVLTDVANKILQSGGQFTGNATGGNFAGKSPLGQIKGQYTVNGRQVTVTITEKPWAVPASTVETKIREYFS